MRKTGLVLQTQYILYALQWSCHGHCHADGHCYSDDCVLPIHMDLIHRVANDELNLLLVIDVKANNTTRKKQHWS